MQSLPVYASVLGNSNCSLLIGFTAWFHVTRVRWSTESKLPYFSSDKAEVTRKKGEKIYNLELQQISSV
jgi:hypothetical protein